MLKRAAALALGLVAWSSPALRASALEDYADEIAKQLDLSRKPSCDYCHAIGRDSVATDTPFSDALKSRGFSRRNGLPSLRRALERLEDEGIDSDGDGIGDLEELSATANPNDPSDRGHPAQGCAVGPAGSRHGLGGWIWLLVAHRLRRRCLSNSALH